MDSKDKLRKRLSENDIVHISNGVFESEITAIDDSSIVKGSNTEFEEQNYEQCCSTVPWRIRRKTWAEIRRRKEEEVENEIEEEVEDENEDDDKDDKVDNPPGQCCEAWPPPLWRRRRSKIEVRRVKKKEEGSEKPTVKITAVVKIKGRINF